MTDSFLSDGEDRFIPKQITSAPYLMQPTIDEPQNNEVHQHPGVSFVIINISAVGRPTDTEG